MTEREVSEGSPKCGAFPADCPHVRQILTAVVKTASTDRLCEEFPAYSSVLLRLAIVNLRLIVNLHVAMQYGLYLLEIPERIRVWRIVSEDSV